MSKIAFLFPGQGAQHVGMAQQLIASLPAARQLFDRAADILEYDLAKLCFEGPAESLDTTVLDGALWIKGYKSGALVRMDLKTHKFTVYQVPGYAQTDGYYDLALTPALGSLWFRISDSNSCNSGPRASRAETTPSGWPFSTTGTCRTCWRAASGAPGR